MPGMIRYSSLEQIVLASDSYWLYLANVLPAERIGMQKLSRCDFLFEIEKLRIEFPWSLPAHRVPSLDQQHIRNKPTQIQHHFSILLLESNIKANKRLPTSKLLFLAVESCNAFTQISATSAQLIP